ncbi:MULTISPECIES: hypothetical protein [Tabrizicola]|uniref:hypothetical protein n=1 Tax=Tabrizicola TaxID=1443919 RepID=UPI0010805137|nr:MULTISPECIES: hypothetical protein [Paracoccaceae]
MQTLNAFLVALRMMESGGDYQAVNTLNFLGAYQFGEAALIDLGYVRHDGDPYDNNFSGGWTGKNGIDSKQEFLSNRAVQDKAAEAWVKLMWHYIEAENLHRHAWTEVGGVELTPSGMLAATHLLGTYALQEYIQTGGKADLRDPYGMPITSYMKRMAHVEVPFGPKQRRTASSSAGSGG